MAKFYAEFGRMEHWQFGMLSKN